MDISLRILDAASGLLLAAATLWCAYAIACIMMREATAAVRTTAAAVILSWLLSAALLLLSPLQLFRRPVVLAAWCAAAVIAHRWARMTTDPLAMARVDLAAVRGWWSAMTQPFRILIGVGFGCVAVRLVHGLLAPCLTWDALTYHLYKPAVWAQSGGLVSTSGPDAAGYYAWFPPYGDALWAWWLLAMRSDVANAPIAGAQWTFVLVACYAVAQAFGAPRLRATATALAVGFTPAVLNLSTAIYVDNLVVAEWAAGVLFLARAFNTRDPRDAVLASAAFAVLAGVKGSVVPISGLGILASLATVRTARPVLAIVAAALLSVIPPALAWYATGSPVYPLTLRFGDRVVFAGNPELDWLLRAEWMTPAAIADARQRLFGRLFFPWVRLNTDFFNLGLGALALVPAIAFGVASFVRRRADRLVLVFLLASALITVASVAGAANSALRLWWWGLLGRLVMIAVAAAALIVARWPSRFATVSLWCCAAAGLGTGWPRGTSMVDVRAGLTFLPVLVIALALVVVSRRFNKTPRLVIGVVVLLGTLVALSVVRDRYRYQFYDAAARWQAYDTHPIDGRWTASWPVWERLDRETGALIAVTAGWDGIGHNWYRYPLMGRRLQNRLIYIPVTTDGQFLDYGRNDRALWSCNLWLSRLAASGAQYFLLLPPIPFEDEWVRSLPAVFVPDMALRWPGTALYRIQTANIERAVCP